MSDPRSALRAEIERATAELAAAGVPSPRPDAFALAAHALGVPQLVIAAPPPIPSSFAHEYAALVARRAAREPLQHIVGHAAFRHVTLRVEPGVFVPRPETEVVAGAVIDEARVLDRPLVVDLCCGTGAIAASVDAEVPGARVVAVDVSAAAVELTRVNLHGSQSARVIQGDVRDPALLTDLAGQVDVVASNPPYIPPDGVPVDPEVRLHDPAAALYGGGADGLDVPRQVVAAAARLLRPGGLLVMEHGDRQGAEVRDIVERADVFGAVRTHRDLTGRDRYVSARRAGHRSAYR